MQLRLITICVVMIIASCKTGISPVRTGENIKTETQDQHTSENALDWAGTYAGTLPCADCQGLQVTIVLHSNLTFKQTFVYHGKNDSTFEEEGKFTWNKRGDTITLISKESPSFHVREGYIVMLDDDGNEITGPLAEKYILKKN